MAADTPMSQAVRLGAAADALAALAAHLRLETERLPADPAVRAVLADVAAELVGGDVGGAGAAPVVGLARTVLRQAAELVENPGRAGGWDQVDSPLLQSIGRLSMGIADAVRSAEDVLPGLADALHRPDAELLDVGTGTGWLAIALARAYPGLRITGIDVFAPALELARANVADAGLTDRIDLRLQDAAELDEAGAFDVVWLPMPFLPATVVPGVVAAACRSLRPGGWLLPGTFAGPPDRLGQLLTDLRTVRSGGHPWRPDELLAVLDGSGLTDVTEVPRTWAAPVRLHAGRRGGS
ncbi:class I SAM-dependent methyltransferase [Geodermatophilus sabuli]|uniref:Class I SAM-dependent methyltransferase n=1 Tax=Geodermatophilus sabuli TaxID=1564158 RepID=A0A7K3VWP3_9ACTN|nr:class I SAM-dependent methyltransferase [Geodermatophilus sabuli]NEK57069.1 class I SAM-dependent methyltransferase [Geodermatophilus sabuli]